MICEKCKKLIKDGVKFCPYCGQEVAENSQESEASFSTSNEADEQESVTNENTSNSVSEQEVLANNVSNVSKTNSSLFKGKISPKKLIPVAAAALAAIIVIIIVVSNASVKTYPVGFMGYKFQIPEHFQHKTDYESLKKVFSVSEDGSSEVAWLDLVCWYTEYDNNLFNQNKQQIAEEIIYDGYEDSYHYSTMSNIICADHSPIAGMPAASVETQTTDGRNIKMILLCDEQYGNLLFGLIEESTDCKKHYCQELEKILGSAVYSPEDYPVFEENTQTEYESSVEETPATDNNSSAPTETPKETVPETTPVPDEDSYTNTQNQISEDTIRPEVDTIIQNFVDSYNMCSNEGQELINLVEGLKEHPFLNGLGLADKLINYKDEINMFGEFVSYSAEFEDLPNRDLTTAELSEYQNVQSQLNGTLYNKMMNVIKILRNLGLL